MMAQQTGNTKGTQKQQSDKKTVVTEITPLSFRERVSRYLQEPSITVKKKTVYLTVLVLFLLGFLQYANTISHDYALDDDLVYKLNTSVQKGVQGIPEIFSTTNIYGFNQQNFGAYRPFTQMIFALEFAAFGLSPHAQHLISVLLFALTVALLFILLKRMFASKPLWVPLTITLLFTVHPIHTEVVANIKSSDELISFLFGFVLSFMALFRYIDTRKILWLIASCFLFLLGLLSKEHIITLLPLIPLTLFFFSDIKWKQNLKISLWFLLPVAIFLGLRMLFIDSHEGKVVYLDNFILYLPWYPERIGTILIVLMEYIRLLFYPYPQSCDYGYAHLTPTSIWNIRALFSAVFYLGMAILAINLFRKRNLFSWCLLFFLCTISIYSHVYASLAATMAERFLFTPSLPVIIAVVLLFYTVWNVPLMARWREMMLFWPMIMIIFAYSLKTVVRNTIWKNSDTLFSYDVNFAPKSLRLNKSAGDVILNQGIKETDSLKKKELFRKSLTYFQTTYAIYKDYPDNLLDLGTAWYYMEEYDSAWAYWKRFAEIQSESPRNKQNIEYMCAGYYNQGLAAASQGNMEAAIDAYQKALAFDSLNHSTWYQLSLVEATLKNYDQSVIFMERAIRLDSANAAYWYDYGGLMFTLRKTDEARKAWEKTLELSPGHIEAQRGLQAIRNRIMISAKQSENHK